MMASFPPGRRFGFSLLSGFSRLLCRRYNISCFSLASDLGGAKQKTREYPVARHSNRVRGLSATTSPRHAQEAGRDPELWNAPRFYCSPDAPLSALEECSALAPSLRGACHATLPTSLPYVTSALGGTRRRNRDTHPESTRARSHGSIKPSYSTSASASPSGRVIPSHLTPTPVLLTTWQRSGHMAARESPLQTITAPKPSYEDHLLHQFSLQRVFQWNRGALHYRSTGETPSSAALSPAVG
jgi:hypothetical protein